MVTISHGPPVAAPNVRGVGHRPRPAGAARGEETAGDGVIIVDRTGAVMCCTRSFLQMWDAPDAMEQATDERAFVALIAPQMRDPVSFGRRLAALYADPEAEALDFLETIDGRVIERYTRPYRVHGEITGRLWSFHDVTVVSADVSLASEATSRTEAARAASLLQVAERLNAHLDLHGVLEAVCEETIRALGVAAASVMLYDETSGNLVTWDTRGFPEDHPPIRPVTYGTFQAGVRALDDRIFVVDDVLASTHLENADAFRRLGVRTIASATMKREGTFVGAIAVYSIGVPRRFAHDDLLLLKGLADNACQAVTAAKLLTDYQRSTFDLALAYEHTLEGWSRALDLRDHETEGHCRRVSDLAVRLGRALGESPESLTHIRRGALLHDIGKMAIPDRILLNPGPLDEEEWAMMRRHPGFARDLLAPISYLAAAIDIPYCHHERWDGGGYPRGLRGTDIPMAARIFAVTDVWDALRSDRPYRKAWTAEATRAHIAEQSGKHFDPIISEAFLDLESSER